ncbi:MAG: hypothetical protein KA791_12845 [Flavobacteriales bacterium]|nr:hypothetical protein [Flavobacteriales bacterium]
MEGRRSPWPFFGLFVVILLGLHAYLGRYAHPMADDFTYALRDVSVGAWNAAAYEYAHWNGRYASNFLMLFGPMRGGFEAIHLYRFVPALLLALTGVGTYAFLRAAFSPGLTSAQAAVGTLTWTGLYTHLMPDMPEGFYWYTGAVTYQLPCALALIALALLIRAVRDASLWQAAVAIPLLFFITGCNEVLMGLLVVASVLVIGRWFASRGRTSLILLVTVPVIILGACLVILAPGNEVRSAFYPDRHQFFHSLGMSALQTLRFSFEWISCPALLLLSVIWWMNHRHLAQRFPLIGHGFGLEPWKSLPALFGMVFLCVFPAYWSTGILGQYRTANVACFFFLPLWFVNISVFAARFGGTVLRLHDTDRRRVTAALLLLVALDFGFTGNSGDAITDLTTGRAERADEQLWKRYDLLHEAAKSPQRIATIPFITDRPRSIYVLDLRDRRFLVNQDYALWFGLKEVRPLITVQREDAKATN